MATTPLSLLKSSMAAMHGESTSVVVSATNSADLNMAQQLQDLAKQLALQMDYNNELLSQLQRLEEQHLVYQKASQEKQAALRQALSVADAARAEANDYKRKAEVATETANKLANELKEARVDKGILQRQLEALEKLALEAKQDISMLREERNTLLQQIDSLQKDLRAAKRAIGEIETDANEKLTNLAAANAALTRDATELRAKQAPLMAEVEAARSAILKLQQEVEDAKRSRAEAISKLDVTVSSVVSFETQIKELRVSETKLVRALEDEQARVAALQNAAARDADILTLKDGEIMAAHQKAMDANNEALRLADENALLKREVESLGLELGAITRARTIEKEHYEDRLQEAHDDIRRIAEEARLREANHAAEAARKAEELIIARRSAEDQYASLQRDMQELHDLVSSLRNDKAAQARAFDEERASFQTRISELSHRTNVAQEVAEKAASELRTENATLRASVTTMQQDATAKSERHMAMLNALQGALQQLRADAEAAQADYATLVAATKAMHAHIGDALANQQHPLQQWYEEVQRAFLYLMDLTESAKKATSEANDRVRKCEVALEDSRAQALMLEESISRLEHDLDIKTSRLNETAALLEARELASAESLRAAAAVNEDLQAEVARLKNALDKSNRVHVSLQAEGAQLASELADMQAKYAARVSALDEQNANLQSAVRTLTVQVETLSEEKTRLLHEVDVQSRTVEEIKVQLRSSSVQAEQSSENNKAMLTAYAAQITSLTENMRKMEAQLKQTQSLLAVVQEQRRTLQENNIALRAELDDRYRASLLAVASGNPANSVPVGSSSYVSHTVVTNSSISNPLPDVHDVSPQAFNRSPLRQTGINDLPSSPSALSAAGQNHTATTTTTTTTSSAVVEVQATLERIKSHGRAVEEAKPEQTQQQEQQQQQQADGEAAATAVETS